VAPTTARSPGSPPGLRSNGCKRESFATNLLSRTDILVCPCLPKTEDRQEYLSYYGRVPLCSAAIPPVRLRKVTSANPACLIIVASSS